MRDGKRHRFASGTDIAAGESHFAGDHPCESGSLIFRESCVPNRAEFIECELELFTLACFRTEHPFEFGILNSKFVGKCFDLFGTAGKGFQNAIRNTADLPARRGAGNIKAEVGEFT